jgi:hypothetical protein
MITTMRLTATDFVSNHRPTRCDLRVFLRYQQEQEAEPGPYEIVLRRLGLKHERSHLATLGTFTDASAASVDEQVKKTAERHRKESTCPVSTRLSHHRENLRN